MDDLIKEYKEALKDIRRQKELVKNKIMFCKRIVERQPENKDLKNKLKQLKKERKVLVGTESDLVFTLQWMKSGHMPGIRRGIERRAAYQVEKPIDPITIQNFFRSEETEYSWDTEEKADCIAYSDRLLVEEMLTNLSPKEKEYYLLSRGNSMSYAEIARKFNSSRQTVQLTVKRAEKKIGVFLSKMKEERVV